MAKEKIASTVPPGLFSVGNGVYFEHAREVPPNLNYAAGENPHTHVSLITAPSAWGITGEESGPQGVTYPGLVGPLFKKRVFCFDIWIDPDVQEISGKFESIMVVLATGLVDFAIGGASAGITFNDGENGTKKQVTFATSSTGTGWQTVTVDLTLTSIPFFPRSQLRFTLVRDEPIDAINLPDPI